MKWFKHDADANSDAKLQNVLLDYGLEGYGLYWYCIELIVGKTDQENVTFELEHDARIIARNVGSTAQKVEEMMRYFVQVGLFESSEGVISCLKLARRLDKSMTSNPQMRRIIEALKSGNSHDSIMTESGNSHDNSHDPVMTESTLTPDAVMQDKIRLDKIRERDKDKSVEDSPNPDKPSSAKARVRIKPKGKKSIHKFNDAQAEFAVLMHKMILEVNPQTDEPNFTDWANTIRMIEELDKRSPDDIYEIFAWANQDSFWQTNIRSPKKLRDQWSNLYAQRQQRSSSKNQNTNNGKQSLTDEVRSACAAEFESLSPDQRWK